MARCFPNHYVSDHGPNHVETVFFGRLRDELPHDYVVLPGLERAAVDGFPEGEADFIILHPRGRLLLEIKGGGWKRRLGTWFRLEKKNWIVHKPCLLSQSRRNCHSLRKDVQAKFPKDSAESSCLFGRAIVFPDMDVELNTGEFAGEIFITRRDLLPEDGLAKVMERLFDFAETQYRLGKQGKELKEAIKKENYHAKVEQREPVMIEPKPLESYDIPARLTPEQVMAVAEALRPDFKPVFNLSADEVNRALIRFSASQLRVLDAVERSKRLRISGGPGSGKTLLAFESVRRELRERPESKVAMVCFNRGLGGFLGDVARSEGLGGLTVGSFYVHVDKLLGDEGRSGGDADYYRDRVDRAMAAAKALPEEHKFDLLVVDEGQDFRGDSRMLAFMDAVLKGGFSKGRWRWFEDLNQILTPATPDPVDARLAEITGHIDEQAEVVVAGNWRNTEQIVELSCKALGATYVEDELGLQGPAVENGVAPEGREADMLGAVLEHLVAKEIAEGRYQAEDVVVLSMRGGAKASFEGKTSLGGFPVEPYEATQPAKPGVIRTSSVFKFKGLEAHTVILTDLDSLAELRDRRKAYVGITRARYRLFVLGAKDPLSEIFK